jgi:hypothetical protein
LNPLSESGGSRCCGLSTTAKIFVWMNGVCRLIEGTPQSKMMLQFTYNSNNDQHTNEAAPCQSTKVRISKARGENR